MRHAITRCAGMAKSQYPKPRDVALAVALALISIQLWKLVQNVMAQERIRQKRKNDPSTMKEFIITIVLLTVSFMSYSQERCDYCRGRGYVVEEEHKTCSNCGGERARTWTETKICSLCQGTGRIYDKQGKLVKYCNSCNEGKVTIKRTEVCGKCGGKGGYYVDVEKRCPRCGGSGKKHR